MSKGRISDSSPFRHRTPGSPAPSPVRLAFRFAPLAILLLSACAQTNALMGNHQDAAYNYRASAQASEKSAKKNSDLQNHVVATKNYIDAARSRVSSGQEYQKLGNPTWAKNMFDKAGADLTSAATEIRSAEDVQPH